MNGRLVHPYKQEGFHLQNLVGKNRFYYSFIQFLVGKYEVETYWYIRISRDIYLKIGKFSTKLNQIAQT